LEPQLDRLEAERDNVRSALIWLEDRGEPESLLRLAGALRWFWYVRGPYHEAREWLRRAWDRNPASTTLAAAKVVGMLGLLTIYQGDLTQASTLIAESLRRCREAGNLWETGTALLMVGRVAFHQGRFAEAMLRTEEALRCLRRLGHDQPQAARFASDALSNLGCMALTQGNTTQAATLLEAALAQQRQLGFAWGSTQTLLGLGDVARLGGNFAQATSRYHEGLALSWEQRDRRRMASALAGLADVAIAQGQWERAARLFGATAALIEMMGTFALFPFDQRVFEAGVSASRAAMRAEDFSAAWEAGHVMPLHATVAEALTVVAERDTPSGVKVATEARRGGTLTRREREVLRWLVEGDSNPQIAARLSISDRTVDNHVASILAKLDCPGRTAAVAVAVRHGLV
jgi:non-specific serine/threonine protein kinase